MRTRILAALSIASTVALGGCADGVSSPTDLASDLEPLQAIIPGDNVLAVTVCHIAYEVSEASGVDDGTLGRTVDFFTSSTGGNPVPTVSVVAQDRNGFDAEECRIVWRSEPVVFDDETEVTVEADLPTDMGIEAIVFTGQEGHPVPDEIVNPTSSRVTLVAQAGMTVWFKTVTFDEPPTVPGASEGCTPGYWRQPHHFDDWVDYAPDDDFGEAFGVDVDGVTLLRAVWARGGGERALMRHAVAALLNAASEVDYAYTVDEVIRTVQDAYDSGDFEGAKNALEEENEKGCPLGNGGDDEDKSKKSDKSEKSKKSDKSEKSKKSDKSEKSKKSDKSDKSKKSDKSRKGGR